MPASTDTPPLRVVTSMATAELIADLLTASDRGGPACAVESVGGVAAAERVRAGEQFDVVVLGEGAIAALTADGYLDAGSVRPVAQSLVAVGVRAGEPAPAIGSAAQVWDAIRAADAVGYSTGPSGTALLRLIDGWGGQDSMPGRLVQARPGVPVATLLADGEVTLGFQQLSELAGQPGVDVIGTLPEDCAIITTFTAAVPTAAQQPQAAAQVLDELASPDVAATVRAHHMTPAPRRERQA